MSCGEISVKKLYVLQKKTGHFHVEVVHFLAKTGKEGFMKMVEMMMVIMIVMMMMIMLMMMMCFRRSDVMECH